MLIGVEPALSMPNFGIVKLWVRETEADDGEPRNKTSPTLNMVQVQKNEEGGQKDMLQN